MLLPLRSYIIFVAGLLAATFGLGQVWSLALALRAGDSAHQQILAGGLGLLLLLGAGLVVGRFLLVVGRASRRKSDAGGQR